MNPEEQNEPTLPGIDPAHVPPDNDPAIPALVPQSDESAGVVRDTSEDSETEAKQGHE